MSFAPDIMLQLHKPSIVDLTKATVVWREGPTYNLASTLHHFSPPNFPNFEWGATRVNPRHTTHTGTNLTNLLMVNFTWTTLRLTWDCC